MQSTVRIPCLAAWGASTWPDLEVHFESSPVPADGELYQRVNGEYVCVDVARGRAHIPQPDGWTPDDLLHPHVTVAAHLHATAYGDVPVHAGSCAHAGGGWVLLGDHEQGKSTLLAFLRELGVEPLADDLTVVRGDRVCAGPRCLDLRPASAEYLGIGEPARLDLRRRVALEPVAAEHPLRGFLHLRWADRVSVRPLAPRERLQRLLVHLGHLRGLEPRRLFELSAVEHYELSRPRDFAHAMRAATAVRDLMGSA